MYKIYFNNEVIERIFNSSHSSMITLAIIRICIRISSLPYCYDVDALGNSRSNGNTNGSICKNH